MSEESALSSPTQHETHAADRDSAHPRPTAQGTASTNSARRGRLALAPGERIRVLVVDDSVVIRRLVADTLATDPAIEVAGVAANGNIALARVPQVNPHVITLDIEMPELDGIATLRLLRKQYPDIRVIMFSTLTQRGAEATIEALSLGASDYVTKASNTGSIGASTSALRGELLPKIKSFFGRDDASLKFASLATGKAATLPAPRESAPTPTPSVTRSPRQGQVRVFAQSPQAVVMAVSTGGPNALNTLSPLWPRDFPLPVLIVQHMPPMFTKLLADRLHTQCALDVKEASDGDEVRAGRILIAPGDYHMRVRRERTRTVVRLDQGTPENSCRPAADVLFRSALECYGGAVIGVVLTGMGQDGFRGATALKEAGATILAQDEETSVVWGMPGFVARAGIADQVLPLDHIVPGVLQSLGQGSR
jgi:two-component system, chemotaxis family, protein-glutamate methylesterase/glutaminase